MAIAPSNNLLSALSQLQGSSRPAAPARPQAAASTTGGTGATTGTQQTNFAAQLKSVGTAIQVADQQRPATPPPAPVQSQQSRPIPTRGGYLGQHVNIVV